MSNEEQEESPTQVLLFKKYTLLKNIGGGAFGTVFLGLNVLTRENVAIKIEERNNPKSALEKEAYILYLLKGPGLPDVISFGRTKRYNILIERLLGRSLYQLYNDMNKKFTLKDICMIAIQILERLEYIHSKNYIHRDIKPHNFLVSPKNEGLIYIIDFGLSKKYKSERGKHVKFSFTKHITGTPRFCSYNAMRGVEQSRRDDLESLSYLILYFFLGALPWQGLKITSQKQRFKEIAKMKKNMNLKNICKDCPNEILLFCIYTRRIGFTENPNYNYMKNLFKSILDKNGFINDQKFSWIEHQIDPLESIKNLHIHKNSPHKRLIKKLRSSLERKNKAKSKEKDNNNDYTLNTIYIDNKKNISDLSGLDKTQNDIGKNKVLIHSNDNNILLQNNLIQLNLDNNKHSYNYPLVIYKTDKTQSENNFNKIAQTFQSNNSNVMQNFEFNFPDKISMINVSGSNFINMNLNPDNDNMDIIAEKAGNISKGIKIHDYIRQEEKEGGVIDKDFDYRQNDFFNINTPVFPSEQSDKEKEIEIAVNVKKNKNNIDNKKNNMIKNKVYNMNNKADNYFKDNKGINDINNLSIINKYSDEYIKKNNDNKLSISQKENKSYSFNINNNNNYNKNPKLEEQTKLNPFLPKKVTIDLYKNSNQNLDNNSAKYIQKNIKKNNINNQNIINKKSPEIKNANTKKRLINENSNNSRFKLVNNTYELANKNIKNNKININKDNLINHTQINTNNKINNKNNNNHIINQNNRNKYIRIVNNKENEITLQRANNMNKNNLKLFNSIYDNQNFIKYDLLTEYNNNSEYQLPNNIYNYTAENNYYFNNKNKTMNLKLYKPINRSLLNNKNINNKKPNNNNIIINNLIIKNNCDNLFYKDNLKNNISPQNKNQILRTSVNRNADGTNLNKITNSNQASLRYSQRYQLNKKI